MNDQHEHHNVAQPERDNFGWCKRCGTPFQAAKQSACYHCGQSRINVTKFVIAGIITVWAIVFISLVVRNASEHSRNSPPDTIQLDPKQKYENAQRLFRDQKYALVLSSLEGATFPEAKGLRDSALFQLYRDTIQVSLNTIYRHVGNKSLQVDSVLCLVDRYRLYPEFLELISARYENGLHVAEIVSKVLEIKDTLQRIVNHERADLDVIDGKLKAIESEYEGYKESGSRVKTISVRRLFETDAEGNGHYDALSFDPIERCVLIADDAALPKADYQRINMSLAVRPLGRHPYRMTNEYGTSSVEYYNTYEFETNYTNLRSDLDLYKKLKARRPIEVLKFERARQLKAGPLLKRLNDLITELREALAQLKPPLW